MTDAMSIPQISTPKAGDTLTPSEELAFVSPAPAVTATVTESPEGGAEPDRLVEELRSHIPTRAPTAVSQRQAFPSFMRRYTDMAGSRGPEIYRRTKPNASNLPLSTAGWQRKIVTSDGRSG